MLSSSHERVLLAYKRGYRVKNGKVISPFTGRARKLNLREYKNYKIYRFNIRDEKTKNAYPVEVHKLIAYQKYGNKLFEPEIEVRHLDGNSLNNSEKNVVIGTRLENIYDIPKEIRLSASVTASTTIRKFTDFEMEKIRQFYREGATYKETMKAFAISSSGTLHYILNTNYQTRV